MKIYSNGTNVKLEYIETKAKFGNEEFTTNRLLVLSVLEKNGNEFTPRSAIFNLDVEADIYGEIYEGGEQLSIFRAFDELLPNISLVESYDMVNSISKFKKLLSENMTNEEFAERMKHTICHES